MRHRDLTPEEMAADRAVLADRIRAIDRELAKLHTSPGPYIVLRDDGAVYAGRFARYSHTKEPKVFTYKGAADKRATLDGTAVWPLAVWQASKPTEEKRPCAT